MAAGQNKFLCPSWKNNVVKFVFLVPGKETFQNRKWNILYDSLTTYCGFSNLTTGFRGIGFICVFEMQWHHPVMTYNLSMDRNYVLFLRYTQTQRHMHKCMGPYVRASACVYNLTNNDRRTGHFKQGNDDSMPLWLVNRRTSDTLH